MKINLNDFRGVKKLYLKLIKNGKKKSVSANITIVGVFFMCPLIVLCHFYGEEYGYNEEILAKINALTEFYGYTEVEGLSEKYANLYANDKKANN